MNARTEKTESERIRELALEALHCRWDARDAYAAGDVYEAGLYASQAEKYRRDVEDLRAGTRS